MYVNFKILLTKNIIFFVYRGRIELKSESKVEKEPSLIENKGGIGEERQVAGKLQF